MNLLVFQVLLGSITFLIITLITVIGSFSKSIFKHFDFKTNIKRLTVVKTPKTEFLNGIKLVSCVQVVILHNMMFSMKQETKDKFP